MKPKFEDRKEAQIAYIEHRGPYDDIPWGDHMGELFAWAKENGYDVPDRGRVSAEVREAYDAAH